MRLLLLAVVAAQGLDAITFAAMPRTHELNPLIRDLHSEAAWLAKALLVVLVIAIQPALDPAASRPWRVAVLRRLPRIPAATFRAVGEAVAIVAICVGCLGAGANLSVLTANAAEAPRSVQEPAPIAPDARGFEQGRLPPAAPGRTPAPPAPIVPRGTLTGSASWYPAPGSVAAAGPVLRRALGPGWRRTWVRVAARGRSVMVRLDDWCQCYRGTAGERVIDLSDDDFAVLAPLSAGLVVVRVGRVRLVPPATDR